MEERDLLIDNLQQENEALQSEKASLKLTMKDRENTFRKLTESNQYDGAGQDQSEYEEHKQFSSEAIRKIKYLETQIQLSKNDLHSYEEAHAKAQQQL